MDKRSRTAPYAVIGEIPEVFRQHIAEQGQYRIFTEPQLASISADTLSHLRVLIIGERVDALTLSTWLPSLRTANPTMNVVGIGEESASRNLANWVDELLGAPEEVEAYLAGLSEEGQLTGPLRALLHASRGIGSQALAIFGLLLVWWLAVTIFAPPPYLLPSPTRVLDAFLAQSDRFLLHLIVTAKEAVLGFLIGNSLGIGLAILLYRFMRLQTMTMPLLISLQAIPIVAFAPLLGVWLGTGLESKVAMAAIICFFPMVVNALQAFAAVEREYLELFQLFRASYRTLVQRLLIPASSPAIIAALKISAGLSVVGAIVAEMTGANRGLGYLILNGAYRLETDIMFVAMLLSGVLGVVFFHMPEMVRAALPRAWTHGLAH